MKLVSPGRRPVVRVGKRKAVRPVLIARYLRDVDRIASVRVAARRLRAELPDAVLHRSIEKERDVGALIERHARPLGNRDLRAAAAERAIAAARRTVDVRKRVIFFEQRPSVVGHAHAEPDLGALRHNLTRRGVARRLGRFEICESCAEPHDDCNENEERDPIGRHNQLSFALSLAAPLGVRRQPRRALG